VLLWHQQKPRTGSLSTPLATTPPPEVPGRDRFHVDEKGVWYTPPHRPIYDRAGFRRATEDGRTEFYVFPEVFRAEIAKGFELQWLVRVLIAHDLLYRAPDGKSQRSERLPGVGTKRVYRFRPKMLGEAMLPRARGVAGSALDRLVTEAGAPTTGGMKAPG